MVHTDSDGGGTLIFVCVLSGGDGQKGGCSAKRLA